MAINQTLTLNQLPGSLAGFATRAANLTPVTRVGQVVAVSEVKRRFDQGRGPDGVAWRPLAHARVRGGNKPLLDTGVARASLAGHHTRDSITVSSNLKRLRIHQFGGVIRPAKAKYLAIPMTKEAQRAGSPRRFRRPLTPMIGRRGGVLLERTSQDDVVQYILVKIVRISKRESLGWSSQYLRKLGLMIGNYLFTGRM